MTNLPQKIMKKCEQGRFDTATYPSDPATIFPKNARKSLSSTGRARQRCRGHHRVRLSQPAPQDARHESSASLLCSCVVETRSGSNARRNIPGLSQSVIAVHVFNDVKDQLMKYHTLAARSHNARPMHDWLGISIRVMYHDQGASSALYGWDWCQSHWCKNLGFSGGRT